MTHAAIATRAARNTSQTIPPTSVPLAVTEIGPTSALYQVKKTLRKSTIAPPSEIHTLRGTAPKSTLDAPPRGGGAEGGGGGGGVGSVDMRHSFPSNALLMPPGARLLPTA